MTTTHTPGPWNWNGTCLVAEPTRDYPDGYAVAKVFNESDVALIAAAPDLLAALRGVVLCADARGDAEPLDAYQTRAAMLPGQIARAYAAIARATGTDA